MNTTVAPGSSGGDRSEPNIYMSDFARLTCCVCAVAATVILPNLDLAAHQQGDMLTTTSAVVHPQQLFQELRQHSRLLSRPRFLAALQNELLALAKQVCLLSAEHCPVLLEQMHSVAVLKCCNRLATLAVDVTYTTAFHPLMLGAAFVTALPLPLHRLMPILRRYSRSMTMCRMGN